MIRNQTLARKAQKGIALLALAAAFLCPVLSALGEGEAIITITKTNNSEDTQREGGPSSLDAINEAATEATGEEGNPSAQEADESAPAENAPEGGEATAPPQADPLARQAFIDQILALAQQQYQDTNGRAQRAQYSGDIYVCKNFTVYLFRESRDAYRMAEYPTTPLIIPDNQKKADCAPYVYGVEWQDVPASEGNPFYAAATFRYDEALSKEENQEAARAFLRQVQRGDYFQMAAKYYYGTGAHSMIFSADYDPETDSVYWTDSNMKGEKRNGERYGYVQYDAVKEIDWFVDAFCRKSYGATLYRLRDDIMYAP